MKHPLRKKLVLALAVCSTLAWSTGAAGMPPAIAYSTYLGGSGHPWSPDKDAGNDVAVDAAGNVYVTGATNSLGRWDADVFVRKLDASGTELLYETYLDANGTDDAGFGIAVDAGGNAYVTGRLGDSLLGRGLGAFVAKLGPNGTPLYQTTFGADGTIGLSGDFGTRVALDAAGNAYVAGTTFAPIDQPFPTTPGAFQRAHGGGLTDAFVVKVGPAGGVVWATLLGGDQFDRGWGIAVDATGSAYVVGDTQGEFPTTAGSFQPAFHGGSDAFVAKLSPAGAVVWSSYLGGSDWDGANGLALSAAGDVWLVGTTPSPDFPVVGAYQPSPGGGTNCGIVSCPDAFVTRVASDGTAPAALAIAAGRIRLRDEKPDVLALRGTIASEPRVDPATAPATVELADASGVVASFALPPGSLAKRGGRQWVARDRAAMRSGGVALLKLVVRPGRPSRITLKAFGDLSGATRTDMTVTVTIGGDAHAQSRTWRPVAGGWDLVASGP